MEKVLNIEGMACNNCTSAVKKCLENIDGIQKAEVSLENKQAIVTLIKEISSDILKDAVEGQGFSVISIN